MSEVGLGAHVTGRLVMLSAAMRAGGVRVGLGELLRSHRALAAIDAGDRDTAYFALRAALCSKRSDLDVFDAAFDEVFGPPGRELEPQPEALDELAKLVLPRTAVPGEQPVWDLREAELVPASYSDAEVLAEKDFAEYTEAEHRQARALMRRLARVGPTRPSRRTRSSHRRGQRPDLRRTVRASLRYGGEPMERHWRRSTRRRRPVVLVCDVSGSMEPYARMLLQYMQACVASGRRVEAFVFGTRLTRVTAELEGRDPDRALGRATEAASDWSGGTRIGDAMATLNREHGGRVGRGAVVVVLSDGWDRGDPELLADEMARLGRCAHRLVWLNPLKAHPEYEPLTRGMIAALPHTDHFLAGNSLASLQTLAAVMEEEIG